MSKRYVRYCGQPIKFSMVNGNSVASVVPVTMATLFENEREASLRVFMQWGDAGRERVEYCLKEVPKKAGELL